MCLSEAQLTVNAVLHAFHRDEPYLFLGAAFSTVGLVCICLCVIRRRFDPLLVWLAIFAHLYGQRLWLTAEILRLTVPDTEFFRRLLAASDYLVPVPAFMFFQAAGFLGRRGKAIAIALVAVFGSLVIATSIIGALPLFRWINNGLVIAAVLAMMLILASSGRKDRDFALVRIGLLIYGILTLVDNVVRTTKVEPYGFAILLACLGYVTARRTLNRDEKLAEIQKELDLARRIQLSLLPASFPEATPFRVAARYVPMNAVAGDLYDVLVAGPEHLGLLIADVSGHGVPAALIASMVKMAAVAQRDKAAHPGGLLSEMNRALCGNTQGQYVTVAYVYLDARERQLRYAAAGHPAMLRLHDGVVSEIAENGLLMAAIDGVTYTERTIPFEPGDRLLLYTDGLVEARNRAGELFGDAALMRAMEETGGGSPEDAAERIIATVQGWAASQDDDLTLLVCDFPAMA